MIKTRPATPSDAPSLKALNDIFNGKDSNSTESIAKSLTENNQEIVCVAIDTSNNKNTLIGFCCGQIIKSMCYSILYGDITEFFVIKEYQQSDAQKQLIKQIKHEFEKRGVTHLHHLTGLDNSASQQLFLSQGFTDSTESSYNSSSLKIFEK